MGVSFKSRMVPVWRVGVERLIGWPLAFCSVPGADASLSERPLSRTDLGVP